eukprot:5099205-Pleurochrysis_carterae.AAC.1
METSSENFSCLLRMHSLSKTGRKGSERQHARCAQSVAIRTHPARSETSPVTSPALAPRKASALSASS